MVSRDFVYAYLVGQVQAGLTIEAAKSNFTDWLLKQNDAIATASDKSAILADLSSYTVKG